MSAVFRQLLSTTLVLAMSSSTLVRSEQPRSAPPASSALGAISTPTEWKSREFRVSDYSDTRLLSALENGTRLENRKVTLVGVLSVDFEDTRLYLTKEAYGYLIDSSAINLSLTDVQIRACQKMQGKYVAVSGILIQDPASRLVGSVRLTMIQRIVIDAPSMPRR